MSALTSLLPGRYYHIYNRGNNRENLFIEERNYPYFLRLYAQHIAPVADTYAYCLLRNHFHLMVRVKTASDLHRVEADAAEAITDETIPALASRAFQSLFIAYAKTINKTYHRTGKLFQEHFGRIEVLSDDYFTNLIFYIHFNPQKHDFVDDFRAWPWSSFGAFVSAGQTKLKRDIVLDWFDGVERFKQFHRSAVDEHMLRPLIVDDFD